MPAPMTGSETVVVTGLSNREFLERYASSGRIGLCGGQTLVDRAICRAQRHLNAEEKWGAWSHTFLFQGRRVDGHHWVIESDLQIHRKHIQLGVQENRITKFFDEAFYSTLGVLDFGLSEKQIGTMLSEALELAANHARYSVRELLGTMFALRRPELRSKANLLARDRSMYCSAFVRHLFRQAGLDLVPGIDAKNTTPEDIARTVMPHVTYLLQRAPVRSRIHRLKNLVEGPRRRLHLGKRREA